MLFFVSIFLIQFYFFIPFCSSTATSGSIFSGEKIRNFNSSIEFSAPKLTSLYKLTTPYLNCHYWGVVTTIFAPSPAIKMFLELPENYCIVVVADQKTPANDYRPLISRRFFFLDVEMQKHLAEDLDFIKFMPWNSFSRKNIGYIFALAAGSNSIFDFDDDNFISDRGLFMAVMENSFKSFNFYRATSKVTSINYFPVFMQSNRDFHWPRGLPLNLIRENSTKFLQSEYPKSVLIWQSIADGDPDVDAIGRLTTNYNISFLKNRAFSLHKNQYTPLNGQSTIWFPQSYMALYLPKTVHGRVSDIWRAYIAECLLRNVNSSIIVSSPFIKQKRNNHDYLADFDSEIPLYKQAGGVINILSKYSFSNDTYSRFIEIYKALYEAAVIEKEDVIASCSWINIIDALGYNRM